MELRIQNTKWSFHITPFRLFLMVLVAAMAVLAIYRLVVGLGPTTNMTDNWPWALWKLPALGWVAITAGGYTTALLVYVLNVKKFKPLVRGAMVVSLLGYILSLVSLGLDVGLWYQFWTPYIFWGYNSILFDVFWCISLYATVQILKFGEIATEKVGTPWHKYFALMAPVLVIVGIMLPTLHQSALGALYVLMVGKLYPLWWTPYIGLFFLMTSFFLGPAMVIIENHFRSKTYGRPFRADLLHSFARIGAFVMIIYLALKAYDMTRLDVWGYLFASTLETTFFLLEYGLCVIIPLIIIYTAWGKTRAGLLTFGILVASGVFLTRINVIIIGMMNHYGFYFPHPIEWLVFFGMTALWVLLYLFIVENFNIMDYPDKEKPRPLAKRIS
ncbi:MAG: polysulfide reductase NrfD [Desulfotomaculum sp.]|nr:polysulfide reductase NrfD [Desulfotomaculum sp.]